MTKIFFKFVYVNITISLYWAVYLIRSQWSEYVYTGISVWFPSRLLSLYTGTSHCRRPVFFSVLTISLGHWPHSR